MDLKDPEEFFSLPFLSRNWNCRVKHCRFREQRVDLGLNCGIFIHVLAQNDLII